MNSTTPALHTVRDALPSIFSRVLVGVDDSPESLEAAKQVAVLATGSVTLLSAYDLTETVVGAGMAPAPPLLLDEGPLRARAERALERAGLELAAIEPGIKIVRARPWEALLDELASGLHTMVAVGSHGGSRAKGIVIGSTATELIHKAPCSVLIARTPLKQFPSSIAVGVDGSKEAAAADAVARDLSVRLSATLDRRESVPEPVKTLAEAAMEADLLVVGSRGLHGVKALGSVSERFAHEARCSVLIVR
jgi:nucleotide-binding universal stress UspA family protein